MSAISLLFVLIALVAGLAAAAYAVALARAGSTITDVGREPAWGRFHVRYYVFALLFIAFDMEMAYMYPWAVVYKELGLVALLDMGVFLMILFLGLLYGWSQGALRRQ